MSVAPKTIIQETRIFFGEFSRTATVSECFNAVPTSLGSLRNSFEYLVYILPALKTFAQHKEEATKVGRK